MSKEKSTKRQIFRRLCDLTRNRSQVEVTLANGIVINGVLEAFSWNTDPLILSVNGNSGGYQGKFLVNFRHVVTVKSPKTRNKNVS